MNDVAFADISRRTRTIVALELIGCAAFVLLFAYCVVATMHWKVVWDQSVFHYIRFLMSRGFRPYSDITDMNLPGCYLAEIGAMSVFGWFDAGWRVYEFFLFALLAASGMAIGGRRTWFAGIFATTAFMLVILSQGEGFALERDEVMAVLCVAGVACFFMAMRRRAAAWMLPFTLLTAFAASLKPTGILLQVALLALFVVKFRRESRSYIAWAAAGDLAIGLLLAGFFISTHSWHGFVFVITRVWPLYTHTGAASFLKLTAKQVPKALVPLLIVGLGAAWSNRGDARWERYALLMGVATGALLYYSQLRPAAYHRATLVAFLALWIGFEVCLALRDSSPSSRYIGLAGMAVLFLGVVPYYVHLLERLRHEPSHFAAFSDSLEADLNVLGGPNLQGQVECLDMVDGCLRALYQERLVQNTGSTGDMLLFAPLPSPAVDYYHQWYTQRQAQHPASVIVVSNAWYQSPTRSFDKLAAWPAYAQVLARDYVLVDERNPTGLGDHPSYRIYARNGSAALAAARAGGLAP